MKTLDPNRYGIQPKMLVPDPDPYQMKTDPKPCLQGQISENSPSQRGQLKSGKDCRIVSG